MTHAFTTLAEILDSTLLTAFNTPTVSLRVPTANILQGSPQALLSLPLSCIQMFGSTKEGIIHTYGPEGRFARAVLYLHLNAVSESLAETPTKNKKKKIPASTITNSLLIKCFNFRTPEGRELCSQFLAQQY